MFFVKEVYGENTNYDLISLETRQLDYYKNEGVSFSSYLKAVKKYNNSSSPWWTRTARSQVNDRFLEIYSSGIWSSSLANANDGISPAFRIG